MIVLAVDVLVAAAFAASPPKPIQATLINGSLLAGSNRGAGRREKRALLAASQSDNNNDRPPQRSGRKSDPFKGGSTRLHAKCITRDAGKQVHSSP